jgi:hypothetical protein
MFAQSAESPLPPPVAPEQIVYRHWPEQFVQWIGPELPYTMIELYVDPGSGATPVYDAVLTERTTGKRIHYANQQPMVDIDKRSGAEAYLATMQLDRPANAGKDATYLLRFIDHAGEPVSWQFIQGSDLSERGGGSSPAGIDPPVLMYRERSAVAGEGAAVKIGNKVSVADVWTEISQPPYFVAYHGAVSQNVDIAVFAAAGQQWARNGNSRRRMDSDAPCMYRRWPAITQLSLTLTIIFPAERSSWKRPGTTVHGPSRSCATLLLEQIRTMTQIRG